MTKVLFLHQYFLSQLALGIFFVIPLVNIRAVFGTKCGIYLAPSTIPGAGLGMFAGDKEYHVKDKVTDGDIVIPLVEMVWNNRFYEDYDFLWDEYTWASSAFPGMDEEVGSLDLTSMASPGVGAAPNCILAMVNIDDEWIKMSRAMDGKSPGVGAITPYHGRVFRATKYIAPGSELFVSYGENYFSSRSQTYGYIPLTNDYENADKLFTTFTYLKQKHSRKKKLAPVLWEDLWELMYSQSKIWVQSRTLNALPANFTKGASSYQVRERSKRDVKWLEENGKCMDNIRDGMSSNPDAGRAAIANRFIPKGGLVSPSPLIHVPNITNLKVHETIENEHGGVDPDLSKPTTLQLLINYCFGHPKSSLLLCPYGLLTMLINHSKDNPNTKIQWSETMRHKEWMDQPLENWGGTHHSGLSFDFVATRDIEEGEEILIDYGDAWEEAWQNHKSNFVPREHYVPAFELNDTPDLEIRTIHERPYELDGVRLWCRSYYIKVAGAGKHYDSRCRVLKRRNNNNYMVQLFRVENNDDAERHTLTRGSIIWTVPRDAFYFEDIPYTRDHYQFWAFRHAMMIPDSMFPEIWMNL